MCSFLCESCPPSACASAPGHHQPSRRAAALAGVLVIWGMASVTDVPLQRRKVNWVPRVLSVPFLVHQFKGQEPPVLYLAYYVIPCGFGRNTFILMLGVRQEAGCAAGWMRCRLCRGSCADLTYGHGAVGISPPSQISHRRAAAAEGERTTSIPYLFFWPGFWIFTFFFNWLWREQQVCVQTLPECNFSIN